MSNQELILLVLGAILGVVVDRLSKVGVKKFTRVKTVRRRSRRLRSSEAHVVTNWLVDYYGAGRLYSCTISGVSCPIPFFTSDDWIFTSDLTSAQERLVVLTEATESFVADRKLIALRAGHGQRLFNNLTYYTHKMETSETGLRVQVAPTEYFNVISNLIALEEEVFAAVLSPRKKTPLRDEYMRTREMAESLAMRPLSFGVNVGFVVRTSSSVKVLLQTRSAKTVTYGGSRALFPSFGLAPIGADAVSASDLLYLNFVKEYLEEGFDYEELDDNLSARRTDPQWFMSTPEALQIESARARGALCMTMLGFGVDCLSGTTTLSLLVELSDADLGREIGRRMTGNWEVAEASISAPSLELVDVFSPTLGVHLAEGRLHTGSAFTLQQIQQYYAKQVR